MTSEPIICSNLEHTVSIKFPYVSMIAVIDHTAVTIFGLCCDISLYVFMKQRNLQLIPWTSNQDDPAIPMKATLVTTVSLITTVTCIPLCLSFWYSGKMLNWLGVILVAFGRQTMFHPFLFLPLNTRKKWSKNSHPEASNFIVKILNLKTSMFLIY